MKRFILALFLSLCSHTLFMGTAWGIDLNMERFGRTYLSFQTKEPGTPPENAFPLVCYIVKLSSAYGLVDAIQNEDNLAKKALAKGKTTPRPLAEKYKDGVPVPMYGGYYVVEKDFRIRYVHSTLGELNFPNLMEFNNTNRHSFPIKPPRWSWNGALACIQWMADDEATDVMVYTMGVPPDPNYVPQIKKPYFIPLAKILENGPVSFWPKEKDFDATIINPKPGMKFKVIDNNFIIP